MTADRMDKATLAAFVDDELSPEEAARVVLHLADHPEDQAYVDRITVDRDLLARAFADIAATPLPPALEALLAGPAPTAGDGRPRRDERRGRVARRRIAPGRRPLAIGGVAAATLAAVAIFLGLGRAPDARLELAAGPVAADSALAAALDELPTGASRDVAQGGRVEMLATFPDARGNLCRELQLVFEQAGRFDHAVACGRGAGWTVEIAVTEQAAQDDGFAPADGPGGRAVQRLLDEIGAGLALDAEEEAAALARGWRP